MTSSSRLLCLVLALGLGSNEIKATELRPFRSDGCSLFPDRALIGEADWCECCIKHDLAYWRGGTEAERLQADLNLKTCVLKKTGDQHLAQLMYLGVRSAGGPYHYTPYRWGYGWPFGRKYLALTALEEQMVGNLIKGAEQQQLQQICQANRR